MDRHRSHEPSRDEIEQRQAQNTAIEVRSARPADIPELCDLLADLFEIEADFAINRERQANGLRLLLGDGSGRSKVFVAEDGGCVIGMCSVQVTISTAEGRPAAIMEDLVVRREHWGSGVGTALAEAAGEWCLERGITRLQLLADRKNTKALAFYSSRGWGGTDLICLRKRL